MSDIKELEQINGKNVNGLKCISPFSRLKYFNVIDGLPPDIMHDLVEGVIRYNFCLLMKVLSESKLYSIKKLNDDLRTFKYGRIDGQSKVPSDLFNESCLKNDYGFKLSAAHMCTLIRIFPLFVGEQLKNNEHYLHF